MIVKILKIEGRLVVFVACFIFSFCLSILAQDLSKKNSSNDLPEMSGKIYDKLAPVAVNIMCNKGRKNGSGSIIGITPDGRALILTACHVVSRNFEEKDTGISLEFYDDLRVKSTIKRETVGAVVYEKFVNGTNDVALILTDKSFAADQAISYSFTNQVKPGQTIAALGYPSWSEQLTETVGRITSFDLKSGYLIFDAKIASGNSGGPLIDRSGRMLGMVTSIEEGRGYALHMNLVLSIVEVWLKSIKLEKRWKHQKYATTAERFYKDWRLIAGETLLIGSGVLAWVLCKDEKGFPEPPGRPR